MDHYSAKKRLDAKRRQATRRNDVRFTHESSGGWSDRQHRSPGSERGAAPGPCRARPGTFAAKAGQLPSQAQTVIGDVTRPETLAVAVEGVDAIVFTLGSDSAGKAGAESVNYGGVRNVLAALGARTVRIALMTSIGVTNRTGAYNRSTEAHDWKRRSERLVRASGLPYTVVRPGWFDANAADELKLLLLQGDTRQTGTPADGKIARPQIAQVLVSSLTSPHALRKTFELVAETGAAQENFDTIFAALDADSESALDGVRDANNQPLEDEPQRVKNDLRAITANRPQGLQPMERL